MAIIRKNRCGYTRSWKKRSQYTRNLKNGNSYSSVIYRNKPHLNYTRLSKMVGDPPRQILLILNIVMPKNL